MLVPHSVQQQPNKCGMHTVTSLPLPLYLSRTKRLRAPQFTPQALDEIMERMDDGQRLLQNCEVQIDKAFDLAGQATQVSGCRH